MERRRSARRDVAYQDKQLVITKTTRPLGLRLAGAVDAANVDAVASVLGSTLRANPGAEVHVDVAGLEFSDVSGIRALVAAAEGADGDHHLVLHGIAPLMGKVMDVVGWTDLPSLTISEQDFPAADGHQPAEDSAPG